MDVLFKSVHGSRLYNTHKPNSDYDYFTVIPKVKTNKKKYARQSIVGDIDSLTMDLGTWLHYCEEGVPQALEAMFSTMVVEDHLAALRAQYTVSTGVYAKYLRTMKAFAFWDQEGAYKRKRHALRLALNMREMRARGRFNPTLSDDDRAWTALYANMPDSHVYRLAQKTAWS